MALEIHENKKEALMGDTWLADRKLWLTEDGEVVEDGDPRAARLYATEHYPIPRAEAEQHGLIKQAAKPRDKQRKAPARNKAEPPGENEPPAYSKETNEVLEGLAAERGLQVEGTGQDGRVLKRDLVAALEADDAAEPEGDA